MIPVHPRGKIAIKTPSVTLTHPHATQQMQLQSGRAGSACCVEPRRAVVDDPFPPSQRRSAGPSDLAGTGLRSGCCSRNRSMTFALLHPIGNTGILHPVQGGKFDPLESAALKSVRQSLAPGQRRAHPPVAVRFQDH